MSESLADLDALYDALAQELARLAPVCELSGRCCKFAEYGHDMFVTTLELDQLIARHGPPGPLPADGCPYQDGLACTAREGRPLGCRTYYCDPTYQRDMVDVAARYHRQLQALHEAHGVPYRYGEFRRMLVERGATPSL